MRKIIIMMILGVFFQACTVGNDIISDVKQVRATHKNANIDISDITGKYIAFGQHRDVVENYLKANNFSIYLQPAASDNTVPIIAIYNGCRMGFINFFGFYDEVKIVVVFENDAVKRVEGKLIYRAL